ncbi:MAG: AtpZ/AtpI family protein [Anaerolineales bacterium]|nr:AtpZ/AtpI family protein [Anaerolineales bacterium]
MNQENKKPEAKTPQTALNMAVITVAGQVGCLTLVIILGSLIVGLLLDRLFDTRPLFTILFMVGSMPLTWVAIFWVVNRAKDRFDLKPASAAKPKPDWEEAESDRD